MSANGVPMEFDGSIVTPSAGTIRRLDDIPNIQTIEIPPIDYLVPGMIARNTLNLWAGADGTAKTFLAMRMGLAVATGGLFLGRRCQRAPVLYLDYENPSFAIRDRLDLMTGGTVAPDLHVWGTWLEHQPPQIGSELLLTIAKDSKPLIIVDPFRYAHGAEENDSTEMMGVMQCLRYCAAAGGAVIILHHPSRAEGSTGRGSTAIKGAVDVAYLQEMADPNDGGLITLKCIKNRFGETQSITIRPNFEEATFEVTDSAQFTKRTAESEKLMQIIAGTPGLSQNALWKQSGMMKKRFVNLLKEGRGTLWIEEKDGSSLRYLPAGTPVLKSENNPENNRTGQGSGGCSSVLSPLGENREQPPLDPMSVLRTGAHKPNGKSLSSCPGCGGFALYRTKTGGTVCQTCEAGQA